MLKTRSQYLPIFLSCIIVVFFNMPYWKAIIRNIEFLTPSNLLGLVPVFISAICFINAILSLFNFKYLAKPIYITIFLLNSVTLYFMNVYGIRIDKSMIGNISQTDMREALELFNIWLLGYLMLFGIVPSILLYKTKIEYKKWRVALRQNLFSIAISALIFVSITGAIFVLNKRGANVFWHIRVMRNLLLPVNYLDACKVLFRSSPKPAMPIGQDAKLTQKSIKKTIFVLVVGESARATNFSLNSYNKDTNPNLSKLSVISFSNFYSCDTNTIGSLPCIFSHLGKGDFDYMEARSYENLIDIIQRSGFQVVWRNNNGGCKNVCDRIPYENMDSAAIEGACEKGRWCYDEVLLHDLQKHIPEGKDKNVFIVLHQNGSHGPDYHLRHPDRFTKFTPICTGSRPDKCTQEELTNAYDNTIVYTDHFLSELIGFLKHQKGFNTAMMYVPDHGESLGENDVYAHSMPYRSAPKEQLHIPFILWFSDGFKKSHGIDEKCLKQNSAKYYSHDNVFHSLLGALNISTKLYDPKLDIFKQCRS